VVRIAPFLVPTAATALALVMVPAMAYDPRHKEYRTIAFNTVLLLAVFVAWGRFGAWAF
jgi:hypothetical protein